MTTRHRITTAVVVALGFATGAGSAWAYPSDLTPNGSQVPAGSPSVTAQATVPNTPPTIVRAGTGGFDWGDAGIGAGGGFAIAMIGVGGALVASQRRGRRTLGTPQAG